jgi:hypothetical protein
MCNRSIDVFFYGLFMDSDVLHECQVAAANPRRACVDGYGLRIGRRATLVPAPEERAYGMVFALTHDELDRLYSGPGLEPYRPEAVHARLLEGGAVPALCYNLREAPGPDETNAEYAARLREVLGRLGFPPEYVASIP